MYEIQVKIEDGIDYKDALYLVGVSANNPRLKDGLEAIYPNVGITVQRHPAEQQGMIHVRDYDVYLVRHWDGRL